MKGKGIGVPKPEAKHNFEEQEIIGGFGPYKREKLTELDLWEGAILSAELAVSREPGASVEPLVKLCKADPDPRFQMIGELLARYPLRRGRGAPWRTPIIYKDAMPAQQVRLRYWAREYNERSRTLREQIEQTPPGGKRRDLEERLSDLIDAVADEGELSRDTFRNHLSGDHGPSQEWKRKHPELDQKSPKPRRKGASAGREQA